MPRCNGSYIGFDVSPTVSTASGVWTVREAEALLRANKWPAQPTVPGAPTGTPGNAQVGLTWTAPTGGSTVTDYEVQYSSNSGSTWTTFSDGVSTATSATVTGLTNGTGYIFRVRAINALGEGPYGSSSGTITPAAVTPALLLNFNGSNGSTTFTDSSPTGWTVTANGSAALNTSIKKFGTASASFTSGTATISSSSGTALIPATGDWTVEAWVYLNSHQAYDFNAVFGSNGSVILGLYGTGLGASSKTIAMEHGGVGGLGFNGTTEIPIGEWMHVAWSREGNTFRMFYNGNLEASNTQSNSFSAGQNFLIGGFGGTGNAIDGYIDDLRVVASAIYTASFTPPSAEL